MKVPESGARSVTYTPLTHGQCKDAGTSGAGTVSITSIRPARMMVRAQELCESRGGRPGLPVPNKPTVSVDVKQHFNQQMMGQKGGKKCVLSSCCFSVF